MSDQIIDLSIVEETKSVMKDKFPMMVEFFLEDGEEYINAIKKAMEAKDASQVVSPSHTIKSSAKQLGAIKLSEYAKKAEELSRSISEEKNGDISELQSICDSLYQSFDEVVPELKKQL